MLRLIFNFSRPLNFYQMYLRFSISLSIQFFPPLFFLSFFLLSFFFFIKRPRKLSTFLSFSVAVVQREAWRRSRFPASLNGGPRRLKKITRSAIKRVFEVLSSDECRERARTDRIKWAAAGPPVQKEAGMVRVKI